MPDAVFVAPMTNMFGMKVAEIGRLLEALCDPQLTAARSGQALPPPDGCVRALYVVIDNTTLGRLARWQDFNFARLPDFVKILSFESLVKHGQDGQDLAPAGLVVAIGKGLGCVLRSVREQVGSMPAEISVRRLEHTPDSEMLDRRMRRHSRNTSLLCRNLQDVCRKSSFFREVNHPFLENHPQHRVARRELRDAGAIFTVRFNLDFMRCYTEHPASEAEGRTVQAAAKRDYQDFALLIAKAYLKLVVELARRSDLELNAGSSFGFNSTRIVIYTRQLPPGEEADPHYQREPYLRVAPGIENVKDMKILLAVLKRASEIFMEAVSQRRILALSTEIMRGTINWIQSPLLPQSKRSAPAPAEGAQRLPGLADLDKPQAAGFEALLRRLDSRPNNCGRSEHRATDSPPAGTAPNELCSLEVRALGSEKYASFRVPRNISFRDIYDRCNAFCRRHFGRDAVYPEALYQDEGVSTPHPRETTYACIPVVDGTASMTPEQQGICLKRKELSLADRPVVAAAAALYLCQTWKDLLEGKIVRTRSGAIAMYGCGLAWEFFQEEERCHEDVVCAGAPIG